MPQSNTVKLRKFRWSLIDRVIELHQEAYGWSPKKAAFRSTSTTDISNLMDICYARIVEKRAAERVSAQK